jgi:hypothetical protein
VLTASNGTRALSWSISAGALPSDLTLSSDGSLSGTPAAVAATTNGGVYSATFKVSDSFTDRSTGASAPRTATKVLPLQIALGYRVNVFPLFRTTYACVSCHTGSPIVPDFRGGKPTGSEDATRLINFASGGNVPFSTEACGTGHVFIEPGDPSSSLIYQKVGGDIGGAAPCGACMPYGEACGTVIAADRQLVQQWINSIPASPTANDHK